MNKQQAFNNVLNTVKTVGQALTNIGGVQDDVGGGGGVGGRVGGAKSVYWKDRLRPASFRGVGFFVLDSQIQFGRRAVVHEYPYRDTVWVEDLGRLARRIAFTAFIVGDDCIAQRQRLMDVCEESGAVKGAELIHPSLGSINVALVDKVVCTEHWDKGRVFELSFSFVAQGQRIFPTIEVSTGAAVKTAADDAESALDDDFEEFASVPGGLALIAAVATDLQKWGKEVQGLISDATSIYHLISALPGEFGVLFGANTPRNNLPNVNVSGLLVGGAGTRAVVAQAISGMTQIALSLPIVASGSESVPPPAGLRQLSGAVNDVVRAVRLAVPSPPDAVRVLSALLSVQTVPSAANRSAVKNYQNGPILINVALSDLIRRAVCVGLVRATSTYQPTSYDDAMALQSLVIASLEPEMIIAGDAGHDGSYQALERLKSMCVQDLRQRGASLAKLVMVNTIVPQPALVLAHRLYNDAGRDVELTRRADATHPAFMPVQFLALAR
jgi:prophage DNA circulation protein